MKKSKTKLVRHFRGNIVPFYVDNKSKLIAWALLVAFKDGYPITNGEFAYKLNCLRAGAVIFNLRKRGWSIRTNKISKELYTFELTTLPKIPRNKFDKELIAREFVKGLR